MADVAFRCVPYMLPVSPVWVQSHRRHGKSVCRYTGSKLPRLPVHVLAVYMPCQVSGRRIESTGENSRRLQVKGVHLFSNWGGLPESYPGENVAIVTLGIRKVKGGPASPMR